MLTQDDLKQIQGVIKKELQQERAKIRKETQDIVRTELTQARKEIRKETREIVKEELTPVKDDIAQIRKDIKTIVNFFDKEYLELRKRIERIEKHLNLPPVV